MTTKREVEALGHICNAEDLMAAVFASAHIQESLFQPACAFVLDPGSRHPDHYANPEWCQSDSLVGSEFCAAHLEAS